MKTSDSPTSVGGFRLALRLRKLVVAVWLVALAVFVPAQLVVWFAASAARGHLPAGPLPEGDDLLIAVEVLRPVAVPLAVALVSGCLALLAWSVLWHAGVVRWWLGAGAVRVRLAEILGHGIVWWWRYARLALVGILFVAVALVAVWLPVEGIIDGMDSGARVAPILISGSVLSVVLVTVIWIATLRAGWLLGESGRRSSLVAWLRGLGATLQQPIRSVFPALVWGIPAAVLVVVPLAVKPEWAAPALLLASLGASFSWVALYLSFAPREPAEEWYRKMHARAAARVAAPAEKPDPYRTSRIRTRPPDTN